MPPNLSDQKPTLLQSTYPVLFPSHPAFTLPDTQFIDFLKQELASLRQTVTTDAPESISNDKADDSITLISAPSTTDSLGRHLVGLEVIDDVASDTVLVEPTKGADDHVATPLDDDPSSEQAENKMLTENNDIAHRSTTNPLVDLFFELEEVVSGTRLRDLLIASWNEDSVATLKIIFNARSIHIGKASRSVFYRCAGWLALEHPLTLLANLQWLALPVIKKKKEEKKEEKDEEKKEDVAAPQVKDSVAHGYYKDLLNLLILAVNDKLNVLADPSEVLNVPSDQKLQKKKGERVWDAEKAKTKRHEVQDTRHDVATSKFSQDSLYRMLHITVARIFASQLATDLALLRSADPQDRRGISLCGKWAPSHKLFHDKHTFIVSSIAEILHPQSEFNDVTDRQTYLLHAREAYRKDVSALRKALGVVERDIGAQKFSDINYSHVPSLAMNRYKALFARKDSDHFTKYLIEVAEGKQNISGAVLLPSTLVSQVRTSYLSYATENSVDNQVANNQWKTLVQRIRDSGTITSSIAICDVSGSMMGPRFSDKTTPMDTAIGLSLLVAEVTAPPFGGQFITFSTEPELQKIDLSATLHAKVRDMSQAKWRMSTDFVAVFEKLLLPQARLHNVKPEDMVKRVFVFSDMQFNESFHQSDLDSWSSSFQRIEKEFAKYGYELPQIVFWNLAGGRAGYPGGPIAGDPTAPKPVTSDENGTALVSGYSQGLLKVFMDNGHFDELEETVEEEVTETEIPDANGGEGEVVVHKRKKVKMDPLTTVKKAISHEAYSVLSVVD